MDVTGYLHSIETLGGLDGPGVRTVIFLQGCPLRCRYCHNPDTWISGCGEEITSGELFRRVIRYKPYYGKNGGVTLSGGEPLAQPQFTGAFFKKCREAGIHTAVDTAGSVFNEAVKEAVGLADLIILDVKHTDADEYRKLTGGDYSVFKKFLDFCVSENKPLWLRQVIVPGITDTEQNIHALARLADFSKAQKTELLPYHDMGKYKWDDPGLAYSLPEAVPPSFEVMECLNEKLRKARKYI